MAGTPEIFSGKYQQEKANHDEAAEELYKQIGKLKVENRFLKKRYIRFKFGEETGDNTVRTSGINKYMQDVLALLYIACWLPDGMLN